MEHMAAGIDDGVGVVLSWQVDRLGGSSRVVQGEVRHPDPGGLDTKGGNVAIRLGIPSQAGIVPSHLKPGASFKFLKIEAKSDFDSSAEIDFLPEIPGKC